MADDKPKKPLWKRWWVWAIGIFILIAIGSSGDDTATTSSTAPAPSAASDVPTEDAPTEAAPALAVGDQFTLGDFTYVIDDVDVRRQIGNEFVNEQASSGASFVVVSFRIRNEGNETETVLSDDFKIVDQRGREFRTSSGATTALAMSGGGNDFLLSELQPGIMKESITAFEVPDDVIQSGFTLVIPQKGFSSNEARIAIQP